MSKKYVLKNAVPGEGGGGPAAETYLAPAPPVGGKIIGLDCHPDTYTAAVFVGQTPHGARKIGSRGTFRWKSFSDGLSARSARRTSS